MEDFEINTMELIQIKPVIMSTKNYRNGEVMMDALALAKGEGRIGIMFSCPGRGKTLFVQTYAAAHDCIYLRKSSIQSDLDFLQVFCRELGMSLLPGRRGRCYQEIIERLRGADRPVFIDEAQGLPRYFLDVILDLCDATACPFVLVGEEELRGMLQQHKRMWSRTYQVLEFDPITAGDIIFYVREATGLRLSKEVAMILHKSSGGDFRIVRRDLLALVQFANAKQTREVDEELARIAVTVGLKGSAGNGKTARI
ncbi:MAG: AAA family ATPase [Syntrophobacteraceae bacterium]